jgi:secreted Zn-dependent insulinase-like peptidase
MRDFDIYGLAVSLTKEGFKHREEIVETIFAYINKMKKEGIPDYINKDLMEVCVCVLLLRP